MFSSLSFQIVSIRRFMTALALGAMLVASLPATASAQTKIGFVDLQKALNTVSEGKAAKKKLKTEFEKKQKDLNKQQEQLKTLKAEIEGGMMMLSDDKKRQKVTEFQAKLAELQNVYLKHQQELAQAEAKATKKIFDKMGVIIEKIAKERGYDLVLERTESALLYAKDDMDLTAELIKRYDKK